MHARGGGVNSYYNCNSATLPQDEILGEVLTRKLSFTKNHTPLQGRGKNFLAIKELRNSGEGLIRRAELTNRHSEAFYNYLCRLLLRLTNCHSEALAEESLKLSNSYRDSSVVSLLQNDRCKCISSPDGVRGGSSRRENSRERSGGKYFFPSPRGRAREGVHPARAKLRERSEQNLLFPYYPISLFPFKKGGVPC